MLRTFCPLNNLFLIKLSSNPFASKEGHFTQFLLVVNNVFNLFLKTFLSNSLPSKQLVFQQVVVTSDVGCKIHSFFLSRNIFFHFFKNTFHLCDFRSRPAQNYDLTITIRANLRFPTWYICSTPNSIVSFESSTRTASIRTAPC